MQKIQIPFLKGTGNNN